MKIQGKNPVNLDIGENTLQKAKIIQQNKVEESKKGQKSEKLDKNTQTKKIMKAKDAVEFSKEGRLQSVRQKNSQNRKLENNTRARRIESELVNTRRNQREQQYLEEVNSKRQANRRIGGALSRISQERKEAQQRVGQSGNETFEKRAQVSREARAQKRMQEEQNENNGRNNGPVNLLA